MGTGEGTQEGSHMKPSHREYTGGSVLQGKSWKQCGPYFRTALHSDYPPRVNPLAFPEYRQIDYCCPRASLP